VQETDATTELGRLPLHEEVARILRRRRVSGVRVAVTTVEEAQAVEAVLHHRRAEVERVPVGREVEAPPPIRQEGDTLVVPVLEERLVVVRRLVLTEEIHFRFRMEEEAVSVPVTLRRQQVAVERSTPTQPDETSDRDDIRENIPGEPPIMNRTLTALFDTRPEADRAAEALRGLNVHVSNVQVHDAAGAAAADDDRLNYSAIGSMWLPEEDRAIYQEGLRRGGAIVSAEVAEHDMDLAMDAMEAAGAVDLDAREQQWRSQGWAGATTGAATGAGKGASGTGSVPDGAPGNPPGTMASRALDRAAGTNISGAHPENEAGRARSGTGTPATGATGREEAIPIAEESLRIGKRMAHGGRVRVRSYVVETPVEEEVRLREERVRVERRPADRPATGSEAELFRDRVIEAEESSEEAVVQKDVRVTGEVVVNKETTERTETIRDTVRRTEVDVDKDQAANDPTRRGGKGAA